MSTTSGPGLVAVPLKVDCKQRSGVFEECLGLFATWSPKLLSFFLVHNLHTQYLQWLQLFRCSWALASEGELIWTPLQFTCLEAISFGR